MSNCLLDRRPLQPPKMLYCEDPWILSGSVGAARQADTIFAAEPPARCQQAEAEAVIEPDGVADDASQPENAALAIAAARRPAGSRWLASSP